MNSEPFLKPRLTGPRFENGGIPLELLGDFAVLSEMIVEVAKWKFKEKNPKRKRVPRGFTDGVSLKLTSVEHGSVIPCISMSATSRSLFGFQFQSYFEEARSAVISSIGAAERGESIVNHLPQELLGYFDRFGRNLNPDEAIEFTDPLLMTSVKLTRETRRKLVLASSADEVTEEIIVHGTIPDVDKHTETFQILLLDGNKIRAPLTNQHRKSVMEAFNNYEVNQKVRIYATGRFNRSNRLQSLSSVEHISLLDPLDIGARIEELKLLKVGWLDGKGTPPSQSGLEWLAREFDRSYPVDLPSPYLFPTPEGDILLEWSLKPWSASLEIDLEKNSGDWHALNLSTDEESLRELDLMHADSWFWLAEQIRSMGGEAE